MEGQIDTMVIAVVHGQFTTVLQAFLLHLNLSLLICFTCLQMILDVTSNMAALEVGGGPWFSEWKGTSSSSELVSRALRVPVDVESLVPLPFLRPPGL